MSRSLKSILRQFYYAIGPNMRFLVRRLYYLPQDIFRSSNDIPPKGLIYTGSGDYVQQATAWKDFFVAQGLKPSHALLDIGSGIGRIAYGLKNYLTGRYEGFEAMKVGVEWCQKHITPKHTNFNFKWVSLYNDLYNSDGADASEYRFDYADASFDFAVSISVFTHMIDTEVENYLSQTHRVLRNGGLLVATFFICDETTKQFCKENPSAFQFPYDSGNYYLMDSAVKSANVCFKREYLMDVLSKAGFTIINEVKGYWSGRPETHYLGFQDILVLKKG